MKTLATILAIGLLGFTLTACGQRVMPLDPEGKVRSSNAY